MASFPSVLSSGKNPIRTVWGVRLCLIAKLEDRNLGRRQASGEKGEVTNACLPSPSRWGSLIDTRTGRRRISGGYCIFQPTTPGSGFRSIAFGRPAVSPESAHVTGSICMISREHIRDVPDIHPWLVSLGLQVQGRWRRGFCRFPLGRSRRPTMSGEATPSAPAQSGGALF